MKYNGLNGVALLEKLSNDHQKHDILDEEIKSKIRGASNLLASRSMNSDSKELINLDEFKFKALNSLDNEIVLNLGNAESLAQEEVKHLSKYSNLTKKALSDKEVEIAQSQKEMELETQLTLQGIISAMTAKMTSKSLIMKSRLFGNEIEQALKSQILELMKGSSQRLSPTQINELLKGVANIKDSELHTAIAELDFSEDVKKLNELKEIIESEPIQNFGIGFTIKEYSEEEHNSVEAPDVPPGYDDKENKAYNDGAQKELINLKEPHSKQYSTLEKNIDWVHKELSNKSPSELDNISAPIAALSIIAAAVVTGIEVNLMAENAEALIQGISSSKKTLMGLFAAGASKWLAITMFRGPLKSVYCKGKEWSSLPLTKITTLALVAIFALGGGTFYLKDSIIAEKATLDYQLDAEAGKQIDLSTLLKPSEGRNQLESSETIQRIKSLESLNRKVKLGLLMIMSPTVMLVSGLLFALSTLYISVLYFRYKSTYYRYKYGKVMNHVKSLIETRKKAQVLIAEIAGLQAIQRHRTNQIGKF